MRLNELLTNIKSRTNVILKINDLDIVTFRGTKFNVLSSEEYIKGRKKYEATTVTNIDIVKEESETYILIESATGIGKWSRTEWVE